MDLLWPVANLESRPTGPSPARSALNVGCAPGPTASLTPRSAEARPLVTGEDLIRLGWSPGPRFRQILEEIKERRAEGVLPDRAAALEYLKGLQSS